MRVKPRAVLVFIVALSACRPDPTLPPDPDEPTPALPCADAPTLSITRLDAPSLLVPAPWFFACTACPLGAAELSFSQGEVEVERDLAWAEGGSCIVATPSGPPPALPALEGHLEVWDGSGSGEHDFSFPLGVGRGPDPEGGGTYRLGVLPPSLPLAVEALGDVDGGLDNSLIPFAAAAPDFANWRDLLIDVSPPDLLGERRILLAAAGEDGAQDPCRATVQWSDPASTDQRALAAPLRSGDRTPGATVYARGTLHGTFSADGTSLDDVALIALVDLSLVEASSGVAPDLLCAALADRFGQPLCVPCEEPTVGLSGVPSCLMTVWEWASAPRLDSSLIPVASDALPPECSGDDDSASP